VPQVYSIQKKPDNSKSEIIKLNTPIGGCQHLIPTHFYPDKADIHFELHDELTN